MTGRNGPHMSPERDDHLTREEVLNGPPVGELTDNKGPRRVDDKAAPGNWADKKRS